MKKWLLYTLVIVLVAATAANTCLLIQQRNKDGDLEFKLAELNSNLSSVQSDLTALQGEITSLAGVGQKAAGDILAINTTVDQLAGKLETLERTTATLETEIEIFGNDIAGIDGDVDALGVGISTLETRLLIIQSLVDDLQADIVALESYDRAVQEVVVKLEPAVVLIQTYVPDLGYFHGSGFIVNHRGYILTNYHVIEGGATITVFLASDKTYNASVVATDINRDIALIKLDSDRTDFAVAILGSSSDTQIGEGVLAIGYPFIAEWPVFTKGIVSGKPRLYGYDWLQLDAALNHGNSGGPLVNLRGEVVGINTLGWVDYDIESFSLAIPIDHAGALIALITG